MRSGSILALSLVLCAGCGAARPAPPRLSPLPELPFALERGPRELRTAWARAEELLATPSPVPPASGFETVEDAAVWADASLMPFAHTYLDRMTAVTDPLAGAVALDPRLRVFASSIAALLFEHLLEALILPVPRELEDDPASVAAFQAAFADATAFAADETRALLSACMEYATEREDAAAWGDDCEGRLRRLP